MGSEVSKAATAAVAGTEFLVCVPGLEGGVTLPEKENLCGELTLGVEARLGEEFGECEDGNGGGRSSLEEDTMDPDIPP